MEIVASYCTDVGNRKKVNQDSLCVKSWEEEGHTLMMAVVCDGMGGLQKGEIASSSLVHAFARWFDEELPEMMGAGITFGHIRQSWENIIHTMNQQLIEYGQKEGTKLGTTVTAIFLFDDQGILVLHVGDCRLYEIEDQVVQLTEDQTFVEMQVKKGLLTRDQAKKDPRQNIILQCVGDSRAVIPEIRLFPVRKGAGYILCSDGFRHKITENEMYQYLSPSRAKTQQEMDKNTRYLVELCKERNEQDNISVIVLHTL